jgi:hypothetical protein
LALVQSPATAAVDRTLVVDEAGTEITIAAARIEAAKGHEVLRLVIEPVVPLSDAASQGVAETLFERFVMRSAARYGLDRTTIYVRPLVEMPGGGEQASRLFRFDRSSSGNWSLKGRDPVASLKPYLAPRGVELADGPRLALERGQMFKVRTNEGLGKVLRAELLLEGLNPMAERGNVYVALSDFWREKLRAQADQVDAVAVEIVAAFEPRARRYSVRDELGLVITRQPSGTWPPLPVLDDNIASVTADFSLAAGPDVRFGTMDRSRFDLILGDILGDTTHTRAPIVSAVPRI